MSEIEKALNALYKQRKEIDNKIGALQTASKIIEENQDNESDFSAVDKIRSAVKESQDGISATDVSEKTDIPLPTVRSTLSRLKAAGEFKHDTDKGVYYAA